MTVIYNSIVRRFRRFGELTRVAITAWKVARVSHTGTNRQPVLFFNASTRLSGLSQNAAFSLLASWAVRLAGTPVVNIVCNRGMSRCIVGTDETNPEKPIPCGMCIRQSRVNFVGSDTHWFGFQRDEVLATALQSLSLNELLGYELALPDGSGMFPLGNIVLPSLRWRMRLHSLPDNETSRFLCREFMLSAWNIVREFIVLLDDMRPQAAVLFNGIQFPEATAAWLCRQRGIRVITFESGFQPFSGYFVEGQATTYPISIPDVELTLEQNTRLDTDLQKRWQGNFTMAGVKFWNEINGLPEHLMQKTAEFEQVVAVFTNVIFDTTQMYASALFRDMFNWLDELLEVFRRHPKTLFVLRAHPDEARPGKTSRESVAMWFEQRASSLPNVVFIPPQERVSSYELVRGSKFVLLYNSTIGLEAILLGVPALAAGLAPFITFDTVFFEQTRDAYFEKINTWLVSDRIEVPPDRVRNTRRFVYYRTYRYSLSFGDFLETTSPTGYVRLKKFHWRSLLADRSPVIKALLGGILAGEPFELDV